MQKTILRYCEKEKLIENGDYVLAGVSGGADSVCMLLLLKELQKELGFLLDAVHVEHGIRGTESENDAAFVIRLCERLEVPLHLHFVQAPAYAREQRVGLEEAARILRYDCYMQAARNVAGARVKVALAHHADDNAETILFQMIRGSRINGLGGIPPKREWSEGVQVIRPLLTATRAQIEAYLKEAGQAYCTDSTNTDITYSRNKIRYEVLPVLSSINAQAVAHMNQSAMLLREWGDYLRVQAEEAGKDVIKEQTDKILVLEEGLKGLPEILKKEVLHLAVCKAAGCAKDIGRNHVELLGGLFALQAGRSISLPYGLCAKRVYEGVVLKRETQKAEETSGFFLEITEEELDLRLREGSCSFDVPDGKMIFSVFSITDGEKAEISKNTYTKCFDYDRIKDSFQIRTRQAKDYLTVDGDGHKKRLKEYFINEKIPSEVRDKMLLLTIGSKVIWVIGGRISADAKISKDTRRVLKVQITGGNYHED